MRRLLVVELSSLATGERPRAGGLGSFSLAAALLVASAGIAIADSGPQAAIDDLQVGRAGDSARVSFRVAGVFSEDVLDRLHSGIPLTFRHRVELLGRRVVPLLPRKSHGRTLVVTSAHYDSLTRRYELERTVTGKGWPKGNTPPELVERRSTASLEDMEAWMTVLSDVPLPGPFAEGAQLRVRVRSELGRRFVWMLFPTTHAVTDEQAVGF